MSKYKVAVQMTEGNPEYGPDADLVEGIECEGFLMIAKKPGVGNGGYLETIYGLSINDLAQVIANPGSKAHVILRQALAIAEGIMRAAEIGKASSRSPFQDMMDEILKRGAVSQRQDD